MSGAGVGTVLGGGCVGSCDAGSGRRGVLPAQGQGGARGQCAPSIPPRQRGRPHRAAQRVQRLGRVRLLHAVVLRKLCTGASPVPFMHWVHKCKFAVTRAEYAISDLLLLGSLLAEGRAQR